MILIVLCEKFDSKGLKNCKTMKGYSSKPIKLMYTTGDGRRIMPMQKFKIILFVVDFRIDRGVDDLRFLVLFNSILLF